MQIPQNILRPLDSLLSNQAFISNIAVYTKDGLCALYGIQSEEGYCPAHYLLALNYMIINNLDFSVLIKYLPETIHEPYITTCQQIKKKANRDSDGYCGKQFDMNSLGIQTLVNVTWQMAIEYGKEFWRVHLETSDKKVKTLRVEYESMAMLVLKLNQALHHISSVNAKSLPL